MLRYLWGIAEAPLKRLLRHYIKTLSNEALTQMEAGGLRRDH